MGGAGSRIGRSSSLPRPARRGGSNPGDDGRNRPASALDNVALDQPAGDRLYRLAQDQQRRAAARRRRVEESARARAVPRTTARRPRVGAGGSSSSSSGALLPAGAGLTGGAGRSRPSWAKQSNGSGADPAAASGGRLHRIAAERAERDAARRAQAEARAGVDEEGRPLFQPKINARSKRMGSAKVDDGQAGAGQRSRAGSESEQSMHGRSSDGRGSSAGSFGARAEQGTSSAGSFDPHPTDDAARVMGAAQLLAQAREAARRRKAAGEGQAGNDGAEGDRGHFGDGRPGDDSGDDSLEGYSRMGGLRAALADAEGFLQSPHEDASRGHAGRLQSATAVHSQPDNDLARKGRELAHKMRFGFGGARGSDSSQPTGEPPAARPPPFEAAAAPLPPRSSRAESGRH